jgi:hypothetical protein
MKSGEAVKNHKRPLGLLLKIMQEIILLPFNLIVRC